MPRKLKTYRTSIGFFDLAVAASSMKAALEIWGADSNLFHQGFAEETDDPAIVAATSEHPGVVLRRPVGTSREFKETSALPRIPAGKTPRAFPRKKSTPRKDKKKQSQKPSARREEQQRKRETDGRKEALAREKEQARKAARISKAQDAFDAAEKKHLAIEAKLQAERDELDKRVDDENRRWQRKRKQLTSALNTAKSSNR